MEEPPNYEESISALEKGEEAPTAAPDDSREPKSAPIFVSSVNTAEQPRWDQQTVEPQQLDEAPTETYVCTCTKCITLGATIIGECTYTV